MEETIRELKKALQFKQINSLKIDFDGGQQTQPYHLSIADEKIEELTRATAILAKNKGTIILCPFCPIWTKSFHI